MTCELAGPGSVYCHRPDWASVPLLVVSDGGVSWRLGVDALSDGDRLALARQLEHGARDWRSLLESVADPVAWVPPPPYAIDPLGPADGR